MSDTRCPHCKVEIDCTDGPHGQDEEEEYECDCGKVILLTCNYTVDHEARCTGRDHDMVADVDGKWEGNYYECTHCNHYFFKDHEDKRRKRS